MRDYEEVHQPRQMWRVRVVRRSDARHGDAAEAKAEGRGGWPGARHGDAAEAKAEGRGGRPGVRGVVRDYEEVHQPRQVRRLRVVRRGGGRRAAAGGAPAAAAAAAGSGGVTREKRRRLLRFALP